MTDVVNYEIHPVAAIFPYIEGTAFEEFVEDIRVNGQREPVVLDGDGRLIDGRNRARACQALGVDVKEVRYSGADAEAWIISHNVHRRHLTESQRAMVAAKLANLRNGTNRHEQKVGPPIGGPTSESQSAPPAVEPVARSVSQAAAQLNVGERSVTRAKTVLASGDTALIKAVETGEVSVHKAAETVRPPIAGDRSATGRVDRSRAGTAQRVATIRDLAEQGYTSRQIAEKVGVLDERVREISRTYDVDIPADRATRKTKQPQSTRIAATTVTALEGLAMGVDLIDYDALEIDPTWAESLRDSLKILNGFAKHITKEKTQ
jgi:hypothetical protein